MGAPEAQVELHWAGTTLDLTPDAHEKKTEDWDVFDSSYQMNRTSSFIPKRSTKGWKQAMGLMVVGDHWELYVPSDIGYGKKGYADGKKVKPGGSDMLIYRVDIVDIEGPKVSIDKCDFQTREHCKPEENALLDAWAKKPLEELAAHMKSLEAKKAGILKEGEREKVLFEAKTVRQIHKVRSKMKGEEL